MRQAPDRHAVQRGALNAFRRWPVVGRMAMACMECVYQVVLLPFRRRWPKGSGSEAPDVTARTEEYNAAAERYYAMFPAREYLLDKPFSETLAVGKHLIDAGVLIDAMRLKPGDRVVELGAGCCWLSHMLNRFGCRTVALDVSPTALALGRRLFERDPRTNWSLDPQFLAYDGHHLPLDSGSCDRVVINDAFHHIPNQRELLLEMCRVLEADGVVAMSEPGRGHGSSAHSLEEAATTGVLENELALYDLDALARACGFASVCVLASTPNVRHEIPAGRLGAFMGGRDFAAYWKAFCSGLEQHHYILCYKGSTLPTTRRPGRLDARIDRPAGDPVADAAMGEPVHVHLRLTNTGDTRWLAGAAAGVGWTCVGAHLFTAGEPRTLIDFDWHRADLPGDVEPGAAVELTLTLPSMPAPGAYLVVLDLVVEGMTWFADRGSPTATLGIRVRAPS